MVVREYLVQNFKLNDTHLVTIGMGESNESGDSGKIEILIYPAGSDCPSGSKEERREALTCPSPRAQNIATGYSSNSRLLPVLHFIC